MTKTISHNFQFIKYIFILFFIAGISQSALGSIFTTPNKTDTNDLFCGVDCSLLEVSTTSMEPQKIIAADGMAFDSFGSSIASDGNTLVIGAAFDTIGVNNSQGSVYVYVRDGNNWVQQAKITASDGAWGDNFGNTVAVYGTTIAVGATGFDGPVRNEQGAIYIFNRTETTWVEQAKLVTSDIGSLNFGQSLAMNQNTVVVSASGSYTDPIYGHGAVYVFTNTNGSWNQQAKLTASDLTAGADFGTRVDIDDDTIIIGAGLNKIGSNIQQGAAYIFIKSAGNWVQQAKLIAPDGSASDHFGVGVAVSGNTAVVGAPDDEAPTIFNQGSAYVFVRQNGVWQIQAKLTAPEPGISDRLGVNVDIAGDNIIIGVFQDDVNGNTGQGSALLFTRDGSNWLLPTQLLAPDGVPDEGFGSSVVINGNRIFVAMKDDRIGSNVNQGSVYYFLQPILAPDLREANDSGTSNTDNITNSRNLVFDLGGVAIGSIVEFLRNDMVIASSTTTERTVTFNDPQPPENGEFKYSARQIINGETGTSSSVNVTIDTTAPVITINQLLGQSDPSNSQTISFSFTPSEPLFNFDASDISFNGSTADVSSANIQVALEGSSYRVSISNILSDGIVRVSVPAGSFTDAAGNMNLSSINTDNTITRDTIRPSVTINQAIDQADPTALQPIKFTIVFSEPVTGFDWSDISFAGSSTTVIFSPSNIVVTGSGTTYTVTISGITSNGQVVQASLNGGAVRDAADNLSFGSTSTDNRITVDNVRPAVTINQAPGQTDPATTQPINFRVVFSEPITGFDLSDVSLAGSTANVSSANIVVTGSGTIYNVAVSNITSNGQVRASIVANAVQDVLGNLSNASTSSDNTITFNLKKRFFDFDGDGKADVSVFRPSNGLWYLLNSQSGFGYLQFGASDDKLVPADYDGDSKTDVAVFRNDRWYIQGSNLGFTNIQFGQVGDIAVPADYDADGKTDLAVYRPSTGTWFMQRSTLGFTGIQFGIDGDIPVPADFDGDGKADLALFRPSNGIWYIFGSTQGFYGIQFGAVGDKLVPADYDGDGKTDLAVFRPSNGTWYINRSQFGSTVVQFGISTDIPVPADYDGDGRVDVAVYRDDTWFIQRSTAGFIGVQFGGAEDQPIPGAFVR